MDFKYYLDKFQKSADQLDKKRFAKKQIEAEVGIYLDSVFLKLYRNTWTNQSLKQPAADSRIFFSIWINDQAIREQKLLYNIHALKLRQLNGYSIESRKFAEAFRAGFKPFERQWPNVSVKFGPQTLMEGWVKLDLENLTHDISELANRFLEIDQLIDTTLLKFKR